MANLCSDLGQEIMTHSDSGNSCLVHKTKLVTHSTGLQAQAAGGKEGPGENGGVVP